ncbi:MAG: hypothetical protein WBH95_12435 [Caldicoprobacterales bacterium]
MGSEITVLTKQELERNPSVIGENLARLAMAIEDNRYDIESIKYRGFWKKLTTNNTRDLAEAMIKQNDTISAFLTIIQGIIFLSVNNIVVLGGIMDALNKHESTNQLRDNKYIEMAKDCLGEAIKSSKKIKENEEKITVIEEVLDLYCDSQDRQEKLLVNLDKELKLNISSDKQRDKNIKNLITKIDKIISINQKQEENILSLQRSLKSQAKELDKIKLDSNKSISDLSNKLERVSSIYEGQQKAIAAIQDSLKSQGAELDNIRLESNARIGDLSDKIEKICGIYQQQQEAILSMKSTLELQEKEIDTLKEQMNNYAIYCQNQLELLNEKFTILNNSFIAQGDNIRQQNEIIEKLTYQLEELQNQKDKLHSNLENIFIQFNKRVVIGYVIGGIGAVLALISFLI